MPAYRAKRALDLAIALPALVASVPVQAIVALAVRRQLGSPVIFRQVRPGRGAAPFVLLKFRTMRPIDPARGWTDDASRLTPFGRWLRSSSLDELPTLWNVARGDMSLVGPRPLLTQYLDRYSPTEARRHEVRPGVTGLAQASGRNALSWQEKFRLDVEYVDRCSLPLDLHVLRMTVASVLRREGISGHGEVTMSEYMGDPDRKAT